MADLVVRATLRDNVLPQLAKIAAGMQALEKQMEASSKRTNAIVERNANKTSNEIFKIDNHMRHTARRMASRVLLIGGAIAAAAGHAVALTGALWPMIGALGAIPAVTVGGIAGIAALVTGFVGLGAAMKKTGGGASSSASQIVAAQRRIDMANRSLRDSQEALNDAWEEARDNLRDIQTSYAGAQLDVEGAALAVRDAELALRQARSSGDRQERARADLALRQARLGQIEATNRLSDIEQEYNERMAKGVAGSDEVRDANERQADALHELAEAQKALNEAMKGGGGGGGDDAYAKLSASGRKLVDTLKALAPEWRKVQQATQEAMLSGVADSMQRLSDKFLPVMLRQLPAIAQGWNNVFTSIEGVATQDGRVQDIDESLGLMAIMWQRVGGSFGKFFSGFLNFTRVGADFMPRLGSWVDRMATKFDLWSARVRQTGEAHRWIENAIQTGHKFNELIKSWGRSLFEVFRLGQDRTLIDRLVEGSLAFEKWLKTAEGQERITLMWERMRDLGSAAWRVIKEAIDILSQFDFSALATVLGLVADGLGFVADNMSVLNHVLKPLVLSMVAMKVAAIAGNLSLKALNLTLAGSATAAASATTAVRGLSAALGPAAAAAAVFWSGYEFADAQDGWIQALAQATGGIGYLIYDRMKNSGPIMAQMIDRTDGLNDSTRGTAEAYDAARSALDEYNDRIKAQTDPLFAFAGAQERLGSAQERYNEAVAEFGADSPQATQAAWDLARAEQEMLTATSQLANVNGPETLAMLQRWYEQGLITKGSFDLLKGSIDAIPAMTDKQIRITYQLGYHGSLSPAAALALSRSYGSDLHLLNRRAKGGPVSAGEPYVVGEEGPELFVPNQSGAIVPNGSGGGSPAGAQRVELTINLVGADSEMKRWFQRAIRVNGAKSFGLQAA